MTWREWQASIGKRWWRYPLAVEWALEWSVYRLRSLALFELLDLAGKLTVLVVVILWFLEADSRTKERHYRAWELINAGRGSTGDGGRRDALQDLNKDDVSLAAVPLEKASLPGVDLTRADLQGASLQGTNLKRAKLQGADLRLANLQGADLRDAALEGANLSEANLRGASLRGANLFGATLRGANLMLADFAGGDLTLADLTLADLGGATLQSATLMRAYLKDAKLGGVDLQGVRGFSQKQLDAAEGDDRTVLPDGLTRPAHWSNMARQSG